LSRRRCLQLSALAGCSLILTGRGLKAQEPLPADYIRPGPIIALGEAPGLRSQLLSQGSSRTYAIIFGKYDEFMAGLTEFAENNKLKASHFSAIGAFHEALFGWFDGEKKAYKKIPISQQVEVISLVGDIGLVNGKALTARCWRPTKIGSAPRAGVSDDRLFEKFRIKIAALIQKHAADAEKFPWVSRLVDPEL
jgi:Plants and Prokaryotes Conserved (PCC) domain